MREISETVNISVGHVWHISHECSGMRRLSARWMPRLLTTDHKRARVVASEKCLGMFQRGSNEFLWRYVTVDETWIHYYMPGTKNRSKTWTRPGESAPKKAKTVSSAGKVMATIFWDSHGHTSIIYRRENCYRRVLCLIIRSIWTHTEGKAALSGEKSAFPPRQCTSSQKCHCSG